MFTGSDISSWTSLGRHYSVYSTVCSLAPKDLCFSHMQNTFTPPQYLQEFESYSISSKSKISNLIRGRLQNSLLKPFNSVGETHFGKKFCSICRPVKLENKYLLPKCGGRPRTEYQLWKEEMERGRSHQCQTVLNSSRANFFETWVSEFGYNPLPSAPVTPYSELLSLFHEG